MKESRRAVPPASPQRNVGRGKGFNPSGAALAVFVFAAAGLGGAKWLLGLRPAPEVPTPVSTVAPEAPVAPVVDTLPPPAAAPAPAPEPAAPPVAVVPPATPAPAPPVEAPAPAVSERQSFESRLSAEPVLALRGTAALRTDELARDKALREDVARLGAWDSYDAFLQRSLAAAIGKVDPAKVRERFEPLWKEAAFHQAFLRWQVLQRFSAADIGTRTQGRELFSWLMGENTAMEEILLTLKPADEPAKVAALMADAWAADRERAKKYFNLALACAVVFDRDDIKVEAVDAEHYGDDAGLVSPLPRYTWYVEKNEKGKLATSIHKLSAHDLVWVVCAPVPQSELEWAVDKMSLSRKNWGDAYGMVEYLMERAVNGLNPYKEYTFAEILKEGGICGDQSYFCVNTARALGIPAMTISGETDLGGHAWAAVKVSDDTWRTQIGRIGGAANGTAGNPQVGGETSEQEVWLWNDKAQQSRLVTVQVFRHLWLADLLERLGEPAAAEAAVRVANQLGRPFSETWLALHRVLAARTKKAADPAAPEILRAWENFVDEMRRQFDENPRMAQLAAKAESEYIHPHVEQKDARRALDRERRRIERDAGEQKDLIVASLKREAALIHKKDEPGAAKEIAKLYDRALRDYGGSITGFKGMAEDYFSFVKEDPESARKAARDIELAFQRVVESGSKDWFRANTETSIYKMICGYYRTAGEEAKAVKLEKRYQRLLRDAERGAL
jgi:hypothetical protein